MHAHKIYVRRYVITYVRTHARTEVPSQFYASVFKWHSSSILHPWRLLFSGAPLLVSSRTRGETAAAPREPLPAAKQQGEGSSITAPRRCPGPANHRIAPRPGKQNTYVILWDGRGGESAVLEKFPLAESCAGKFQCNLRRPKMVRPMWSHDAPPS